MSEPDKGEPDQPLARVRVSYDSENELSSDGSSYSRETTVWHGLGGGDEARHLDRACHRAALAYPGFVSRLLFGLIGADACGDEADAPRLYLRPFGPTILELGSLVWEPPHDYFFPVTGGLLAIVESECGWDGKLSFRWYRDADDEIFETELLEFRPFIVGRSARSRFRRWLYRYTQTRLHTFVMWRFHRWVRKQRAELLEVYREIE